MADEAQTFAQPFGSVLIRNDAVPAAERVLLPTIERGPFYVARDGLGRPIRDLSALEALGNFSGVAARCGYTKATASPASSGQEQNVFCRRDCIDTL